MGGKVKYFLNDWSASWDVAYEHQHRDSSKNLKIYPQNSPTILLLGISPKDSTYFLIIVIAALFLIVHNWNQSIYPKTDKSIMKIWNITRQVSRQKSQQSGEPARPINAHHVQPFLERIGMVSLAHVTTKGHRESHSLSYSLKLCS